jgi:lipoyl(octanoyl) transferase
MTQTPQRPPLEVRRLGRVPYGESLALQEQLVSARRAGDVPDTLLLVEHPHVITMGTAGSWAHVVSDAAERALLGIEMFEAGRGGDVTYHGPGQLVAYPILDLKPDRQDLHRYLRDLEDMLIRVAGDFGIEAGRREGKTGAWTSSGKLAAIGVRVSSGWITSHGVALNVHTDLRYFDTIVPCGIADEAVTSLERELGRPVSLEEASICLENAFGSIFDRHILVG